MVRPSEAALLYPRGLSPTLRRSSSSACFGPLGRHVTPRAAGASAIWRGGLGTKIGEWR